jgi:two-component system nitrogen regulation response regulator GlnG
MKPVWIVDDDQSIRWVLEKALARASIDTQSFTSAEAVLTQLEHATPSVLVTDIRMPGRDGLSLLSMVKRRCPDLPVIVMTAFSDLDSTVAAFQKGAFDYLVKPFDTDAAVALIRRAAQDRSQSSAPDQFAETGAALMQSASVAMQEVYRAIGRLSASRATVLITGESGTGKELVARALHTHSARAHKAFIALNTAAIPRDLLEAELFGHERGAFTGANQLRRGRFEEADGGTLFLDEIGDMPFELQTRLLRVLAEGSFYRVGGSQSIHVDVRIVAATHQPLEQRVAQGQFREDLFHRLNVIRLRLPPLRERKEDIPALTRYFLQASANTLKVPVRRLTPKALEALAGFSYPGNIRQLENFCHWLTVMSAGQWVDVKDLPPEILSLARVPARPANDRQDVSADDAAPWTAQLRQHVKAALGRNEPAVMTTLAKEFERVLLGAALEHSRGRRAEAAQRLGIGRNTLTRKCRELGLDDESD